MKALCLIPAALSLACSVAFAQSPAEFTQSGQIKIESLTLNGEPQNFIVGSSDARLRIPISDAFKIGADLGVDAVQLDGQSGGYVFATGVIASPYGKLSIGIPRLVMPQVFDVPSISGSEVLDVIQGRVSGELLRFMTYFTEAPTLRGARYDVTLGNLTLAASAQELGTKHRMTYARAATYALGNYSVSIGRSDMDMGFFVASSTKIGLRGKMGRVSGGIVASHQETFRTWQDTTHTFVSLDLTDQITLSGQVFNIITARDRYLAWGVDVAYRHKSGMFVQAGMGQLNPTADRVVNLSLGYQF